MSDAAIEIPGHVTVGTGAGGLPCVTLRSPWSGATVYLHGGHVTAFTADGQAPLLFLSSRSHFAAGRSIRGGVPVIFPWFGDRAGAPAHGFARTAAWTATASALGADGRVAVTLVLDAAPVGVAWPPFRLQLAVTIGTDLEIALVCENRGDVTVRTEHCLHTYLHVGDVARVALRGLQGARYVDKVDAFRTKTDAEAALRIDGETDRVYLAAPSPVTVDDPVLRRRLQVTKQGAASTVVWNPGEAKGRALGDVGDEWRRFLCVESGNVADDAPALAPGAAHACRVAVAATPLVE